MAQDRTDASIEVEGLRKTYRRSIVALDDLHVAVEGGTIFGLLGPNGAGKTTAVRILATLATPDAGTARVAGVDVLRDPRAVRRRIGVVSQRSGVDPTATGRENLTLQGILHGLRDAHLARRVDDLLERFGLQAAASRPASTYSGGMQRRLDIALGLIHAPRVLFLDEPTTGLDPEARTSMWDEIARLAADEGITVLLTTHYLEEADRLAARLAILDEGRIVAEGTPESLKATLHGDTIVIDLAEARPLADLPRGVLSHLERAVGAAQEGWGERVATEGTTLRATVPSGATVLPGLLGALTTDGLEVRSASVARPTLDDVYLRHAGRSFAAAHRAAAPELAR